MRMLSDPRSARLGLTLLLAGFVALGAAQYTAAQAPAETPKARKKDSPRMLRPTEVTFSTSVTPSEARPGDTVKFAITARLAPGWHIYHYAKEQPQPGPINTTFDFFDTGGLKTSGDWTAAGNPIRKKEEAFPNLPFVEYFENEVTWSIPLQATAATEPGKKTLQAQVSFQICDANGCKPPHRFTPPAAVLTVLPGGSAPAAAAEAPREKPEAAAPPAEPKEPEKTAERPATPAPAPAPEPPTIIEPSARTTSSAASASSAPTSEVERSLQQGLLPFLLLAVTGGLVSLVMPCVWPMVPITVNFFVKEGQKRGKTMGLAVTYCLSIIGIFTLVGVLFSAIFGATYLQNLANRAWLNLGVAALFLAFGLSLLGLFEFRLPSFVLNASAQGESRGGLVGVIFMALTLTITSFTCTFPVVGGLLVMAAGGSYLYPVLGLATFATVLALPFFLLALSPGLLSRVPRSGDWMNAVKVVGGLVEIGAAFKFINTAECAYVVPEDAWFDTEVILAVWIVLAAVCGIYLLGLFRTDHDHEVVKVGPGRILTGSLFLGLAMYLAPALFGFPPQSQVWNRLIIGILPADAYQLNRGTLVASSGGGAACEEEQATSSEPDLATRQEKKCHGVLWGLNYDAALKNAAAQNKPVLIDFTGVNCANCRLMEQNVLPKAQIVPLLKKFEPVSLYTDFVPIRTITDDQREELAVANQILRKDLVNVTDNPFYVILSPSGKVLETASVKDGIVDPAKFAAFLNRGLARFEETTKVASARAN